MSDLTHQENTIITNFVLALGIELGRRAEQGTIQKVGIHATQQGSLDPIFGDLITHLEGRSFLIEFKRANADFKKEQSKFTLLEQATLRHKEAKRLSLLCHFFLISKIQSNELITGVVPYLNLRNARGLLHKNTDPNARTSLEEFVELLVNKPSSIGAMPNEFNTYRELLQLIYGRAGSSSGGLAFTVKDGKLISETVIDISSAPNANAHTQQHASLDSFLAALESIPTPSNGLEQTTTSPSTPTPP